MNQWFSHGLTVESAVPAEACCSACMRACIAEKDCQKCEEKLKVFEPSRKPTNIHQLKSVKCLANLLLKSVYESEISYDENSLSEALMENIIEFKNLETFQEFLNLFSLGDETSSIILKFVKLRLRGKTCWGVFLNILI